MASKFILGGKWTFTCDIGGTLPAVRDIYTCSGTTSNFMVTSAALVGGDWIIEAASDGVDSAAPASSGTRELTRSSGSGDATIVYSTRSCPSTINLRDVRYAADDNLNIYNTEHAHVTVLCDAQDTTTSVVNDAGGYTDAQTLENILLRALNATSINGTYKVKNTSTTVPLIYKAFDTASAGRLSSVSKTSKIVFEGADAGITKWISLGTGTGAVDQTILMNTIPSVTGGYIDNPPFVQVEAEAGSGALVTTTPTAGATYTNNSSTFTVSAASVTLGKGTITCTKTTGTNEPSGNILTKASGTGDATLGFIVHRKDTEGTYTFEVGDAYRTYMNIGGPYSNSLNQSYVTAARKTFADVGTTPELGCFFEYDEYNAAAGYGKIYFAKSTGGYAPPSGANIRIPNIHVTANDVAGTSVGGRCYLGSTYLGQGNFDMQGVSFSDRWHFGAYQYYSGARFVDVGVSGMYAQLDSTGVSEFNGFYQALEKWVDNAGGVTIGLVTGSCSVNNVIGISNRSNGTYALTIQSLVNDALASCSNLTGILFTRAEAYRRCVLFIGVERSDASPLTITNVTGIGSPLTIDGCANLDFWGYNHSDQISGVATTSVPTSALWFYQKNRNCIVRTMRKVNGGAACYNYGNNTGGTNNNNCAIHDVIYDGASTGTTDHTLSFGSIAGKRVWVANVLMNNLRTAVIQGSFSNQFPSRYSNVITDSNIAVSSGAMNVPAQALLEYVGGSGASSLPVTAFATTVDNPCFQLIRTGTATCTLGFVPGSLYKDKAYRTVVSGTDGVDFFITGAANLNLPGVCKLIYRQDLPIRGLKDSTTTFDTFSAATFFKGGTLYDTNTTYSFRMSRWGTPLSGAYTEITAANLQTAFDAITHTDIATDGIDFDIQIVTTAASITRNISQMQIRSVKQDTTFAPTEVGFIQVGYLNATAGASIGIYNNKTPATPVQSFFSSSVSAGDYLSEYPYDYDGKQAEYRIVARKAGYEEKSLTSSCWQAGAAVPIGITLNYATTDADIDAANLVLNGTAKTFVVGASHSMLDLYQRAQWWAHQEANMLYDVPLTTKNGTTFTQPSDWTISGVGYITAGTIAGGTVIVAAPATLSVGFNGVTMEIPGAGTYSFTVASSILKFTPTAPGTYVMGGCTISGQLDLRNMTAHAMTVQLPSGASYTTANNTGGTITVDAPVVYQGVDFNDVVAGSTVKVFTTGTQTVLATPTSPNWSWSQVYTSDVTVDYTIRKVGYRPIRVTGLTLGNSVQVIPVQQDIDRSYVASSGLTFGTNAYATPGTKLFGLTVASTLQNFYSFMVESWVTEATLQNVAFPLTTNGPNSFSFGDVWEFDLTTYPNSITNLSRDGMRYLDAGGTATAIWSAVLTSGVPSGIRVRFQQADGTGTTNAVVTSGNMDELVQVYGDATHGNFDKRGYMVFKAQEDGYDQAEVDAVSTYGNMEDQFYVVGLAPTVNGVAAQAGITGVTFTDHGASPVTWNSKVFSLTIKDNADALTGTQILQYFRDMHEFNYHDLVRTNGSKFKTVRGYIYGDTGASLKGVRVVKADGTTSHTDFDLHTADDGTTYVPPVYSNISITSMTNAVGASNRLQIINTTALTAAQRANSTAYSLGAIRLRQTGIGTENTAGLYLRCTVAGTSAGTPPTWNTTPGGTTVDGGVTWTTYKVLFYDADPASTSYSTSYFDGNEFLTGETVEIRFAEMDAGTSFKTFDTTTAVSASGFTVSVNEEADDVYATNALDGSAYEGTYSPNFTTNYIVLDTNTDFSGKSAYAYFCYTLTTSNGMYSFWGGVTALDEGNYRIETDILNLYFDETSGFVKQTDSVRIYRKDGLRPAIDPTTGGNGIEINWRTPVNVVSTGGSALTPTESAYLMALPAASANATAVLAAAQTTPIHADTRKMNGATVNGDGSSGNLWRGA